MKLNMLNSILFHPRKSYEEMSKNDILITIEKNIKIGLRCHFKSSALPNILFFHGNAEIGSDYDEIAKIYNQKNINFIIVDYRGYGLSTGSPNVNNIQSDAHVVLDYLLKYLKRKKYFGALILMGRSLGSVSVLELVNRYPTDFDGLIIESGFANEEPLLKLISTISKQEYFKKKDCFMNGEKIKNYTGPLIIIHAKEDHIIPISQGKLLFHLCQSIQKNIITISNANHNNILSVNPYKYFYEIELFIKNILKDT